MQKKYDSKVTIETILTVSTKLFLEKGFDKTSMRDIAEAANVSKGAIYHHFKSKDGVINAVTKRQTEATKETMKLLLSQTSSLSGKEQLSLILEKTIENQEIHYLDDAMVPKMKSAEFVISYMKDCVNNDAPFLSKIIQKGIDDGSIVTKYPDECAEIFLLLLNVWCDPAVFTCDEEKLLTRLNFLQTLMASLGIDVLNNTLIEKFMNLLHRLYFKEGNNET